MKKKASD